MCIWCLLFEEERSLSSLGSTKETFRFPKVTYEKDVQPFFGNDPHVDWQAVNYLQTQFESIGTNILPLSTTGDGNCLLHAASRAIWGVELNYLVLRTQLHAELSINLEWYQNQAKIIASDEWAKEVSFAASVGAHLEFIHSFVLAHVLRRPLIIFASYEDTERYGEGEHGVAATFLPIRLPPEECHKRPIVLAWSNSRKHHYVPLVAVEGRPYPQWTLPKCAFIEEEESPTYINLYVDQTVRIISPHIEQVIRQQTEEKKKIKQVETSALRQAIESIAQTKKSLTNPYEQLLASLTTSQKTESNIDTFINQLRATSQEYQRKIPGQNKEILVEMRKKEEVIATWERTSFCPQDGQLYDLVFPIEITPTHLSYIGCNWNDDPTVTALNFLHKENLNTTNYQKQVSYWLVLIREKILKAYVSSPKASVCNKSSPHYPQKDIVWRTSYIYFTDCHTEGIIHAFEQLDSVRPRFTPTDIALARVILSQAILPKEDQDFAEAGQLMDVTVRRKLLPSFEELFNTHISDLDLRPILDWCRISMLLPCFAYAFVDHKCSESTPSFFLDLFLSILAKNGQEKTDFFISSCTVLAKLVCNMFQHEFLHKLLFAVLPDVWQFIIEPLTKSFHLQCTAVAYTTLFNYSLLISSQKNASEQEVFISSRILYLLNKEAADSNKHQLCISLLHACTILRVSPEKSCISLLKSSPCVSVSALVDDIQIR